MGPFMPDAQMGASMMAPPAAPPASVEGPPDLDPVEHLRAAIQHAEAAQVSEPDDADSQQLAKLVAGLYAILAARQKQTDQMMGNPTLLRTLRRSGA